MDRNMKTIRPILAEVSSSSLLSSRAPCFFPHTLPPALPRFSPLASPAFSSSPTLLPPSAACYLPPLPLPAACLPLPLSLSRSRPPLSLSCFA
eukprot:259030-Hanusia_phi.AAC.1